MFPSVLLEAALDQHVRVELKDGEEISGVLKGVDPFMNLKFKRAELQSNDGSREGEKVKYFYVKGVCVKSVQVPEKAITIAEANRKKHFEASKVERKKREEEMRDSRRDQQRGDRYGGGYGRGRQGPPGGRRGRWDDRGPPRGRRGGGRGPPRRGGYRGRFGGRGGGGGRGMRGGRGRGRRGRF